MNKFCAIYKKSNGEFSRYYFTSKKVHRHTAKLELLERMPGLKDEVVTVVKPGDDLY